MCGSGCCLQRLLWGVNSSQMTGQHSGGSFWSGECKKVRLIEKGRNKRTRLTEAATHSSSSVNPNPTANVRETCEVRRNSSDIKVHTVFLEQ